MRVYSYMTNSKEDQFEPMLKSICNVVRYVESPYEILSHFRN